MAKELLNGKRVGLTLGLFSALIHAVWSVGVAGGVMQGFLDYIFPLHFLTSVYKVTSFEWVNALALVVLAFVGGYIMGWLYAWIWNWTGKKM